MYDWDYEYINAIFQMLSYIEHFTWSPVVLEKYTWKGFLCLPLVSASLCSGSKAATARGTKMGKEMVCQGAPFGFCYFSRLDYDCGSGCFSVLLDMLLPLLCATAENN